jgi:hypothetical protein
VDFRFAPKAAIRPRTSAFLVMDAEPDRVIIVICSAEGESSIRPMA